MEKQDLKKEFEYYLDNQTDLVRIYNNKYLIIKNFSVVGVFDTETEAYFNAVSKYNLGTFIIQKCSQGNEAYTLTFHSRVAFV